MFISIYLGIALYLIVLALLYCIVRHYSRPDSPALLLPLMWPALLFLLPILLICFVILKLCDKIWPQ